MSNWQKNATLNDVITIYWLTSFLEPCLMKCRFYFIRWSNTKWCHYNSHLYVCLTQGAEVILQHGPCNGKGFSSDLQFSTNTIIKYTMFINEAEVVYTYNLVKKSVISRLTLLENIQRIHVITTPMAIIESSAL